MTLRPKQYGKSGRWIHLTVVEMEQLFGSSVAAQIIKYFGGCNVHIPSGRSLQVAHVKNAMRKMVAAGMSRKDIRKQYPLISPQLLSYYLNRKKDKR